MCLIIFFFTPTVSPTPAHSHRLAEALKAAAFTSKKVVLGAKDVDPVVKKVNRELVAATQSQEQLRRLITDLAAQRQQLEAERAQLTARLSLLSFDNQQKTNQCFELLAQRNLARELNERREQLARVKFGSSAVNLFDRRLARYSLVTTTSRATTAWHAPLLAAAGGAAGEDLLG